MTTFRPINPIGEYVPVPESQEMNPGAGIRINDPNNEENLLNLFVSASAFIPNAAIIFSQTGNNLEVFDDQSNSVFGKQIPIDFYDLSFYKVECKKPGESILSVKLIDTKNGSIFSQDEIKFYTFNSVIIGLGGEGLYGIGNNPPALGQGIYEIGQILNEKGYNVYLFDERCCFLRLVFK